MKPAIVLLSAASAVFAANITFEPNVGQMAKSVDWVVREGAGTPMFLRATGAAITQYGQGRAEFMEMRFDGARGDAESTGETALASYSNYYLGRDEHSWFTGVPHFARVRYHDVYPGIDVVYHSGDDGVEYDFDVHPGADPSQIHISFHGVDSLRTNHGDLILTSQGREVRQRRPRVFQDGREISASYRVTGGHVGIALGAYDRTSALLIDPSIQFASYLGGAGNEYAEAIKVDSQGYIYIAGANGSIVSPSLNPFSQSGAIVASPVIFKFTPDGQNLVFYITMTVDNQTYAEGLAIDSAGNLMIAGETAALQLPLKNPVDSTFKAQVATAFATKWTPDGRSLVYSTYFGGSGSEHAKAGAAVDVAGNLYFAGITSSQDLPVVNALQPKFGGGGRGTFPLGLIWDGGNGTPLDCYVTKLSPQGQIVFSTYLGGSDDDYCFGLALAPDGGIVVGGYSGQHFPLVKAILKPDNNIPFSAFNESSPFVAKLQGDGQAIEFSTFICENSSPSAASSILLVGTVGGVAVDPAGNIYVAGDCFSGLATTNDAVLASIPSTDSAPFVIALDPSGQNVLYRTYAGAGFVTSIVVDGQGSAYVTGWSGVQNFIAKNPIQPYAGGNDDWFLTRLSPSGSSLIFSTFFGGNLSESNSTLAVSADGAIYFAGTTQSPNVPVKNAFQSTFGGGWDIFFMKITDTVVQAGPPAVIAATGGTPQATATNFAFPLPLQARVTDSAGSPVSGVTVSFSAPGTGAGATLSAASAQTDSSGGASVTAIANGLSGGYTVTATTPSVSGAASFSLINAAPNVTIQTSPPGIPFSVNGSTYTTAQSFYFAPGSSCTVSVNPNSSTGPGAQDTFTSWSDGGGIIHFITASSTPITYTANFTQQYQLTTSVSPAGSGTITPASGAYFNAGSTVTVTVTVAPTGSPSFFFWTGPVTPTGPLTGTVLMNAPVSVTANFLTGMIASSAISALLNSASYAAGPVAANEFLAAFGTFPGCSTSNAQVTVDSATAQVIYGSPTQVNFLMPAVTAAAAVRISCPGTTATPFPITLASAAPGLFTVSQDGKGQVDVVNQDNTINTPTPAGTYIAVYGTGFGSYNPPSSDGLTRTTLPVTGILNPVVGSGPSFPVNVIFAGQAPGYSAGLQQINLQIPANVPPGIFQLVLTAGSAATPASATLNITQPMASASMRYQ